MSQADLNGTSENHPISKLRQAFPQFCAVSAKNLLMITFGSTLGFSTILIPELQKDNAEIPVSMEELTWISEHISFTFCFLRNKTKLSKREYHFVSPNDISSQTIEFRSIQIVNNFLFFFFFFFFNKTICTLHVLYNFLFHVCDKDRII